VKSPAVPEDAPGLDYVLIHKGKCYFCSGCSHLMTSVHESCPQCGCTFSRVLDEEARTPEDPAQLREIDEDYAEVRGQRFLRTAVIVLIIIAGVALFVYFLALRR